MDKELIMIVAVLSFVFAVFSSAGSYAGLTGLLVSGAVALSVLCGIFAFEANSRPLKRIIAKNGECETLASN